MENSENTLTKVTKFIEAGPLFDFTDGDPTFLHSVVVYRVGERLYHGVVQRELDSGEMPEVDEVEDEREIPLQVFPDYDASLFGPMFSKPPTGEFEYYVKRPRLLFFEGVDSDKTSDLMQTEAAVLSAIRRSPHRNLTSSQGCLVFGGRVTAFYLPKYSQTLYDLVMSRSSDDEKVEGDEIQQNHKSGNIDKDSVISQLKEALQHLHGIGFAHNDVNPTNVMMEDENNEIVKLIDFDASKPIGEELIKCGTINWDKGFVHTSCTSNDMHGLKHIEEFLNDHS